jgi:hypothetical protein
MDTTDIRGAMAASTDGVRNLHLLRDAAAAIAVAPSAYDADIGRSEAELMHVLQIVGK